MLRGVIASPEVLNVRKDGFSINGSISSQDIRYYVLYWDKVVIPGSSLIYVQIPEEDELIESGVIERPMADLYGTFGMEEIAGSFALAQSMVAKALIHEEKDTEWVLHQIGRNLNLPSEFLESRKTLRLDLQNLLPVPIGDVPIVDILEFKHHRADELNSLHMTLDQVYLDALKSPDQDVASRQAMRDFGKAVTDLQTVSAEKWKKTSKFDFSMELNLDGGRLSQSVAAGAAFDFFTNALSIPIGSIVGAAASIFKFKAAYSATFIPAAKQEKLAYLSYANTEGII